jgi:flagella basal body P-ring formation protein FlgA
MLCLKFFVTQANRLCRVGVLVLTGWVFGVTAQPSTHVSANLHNSAALHSLDAQVRLWARQQPSLRQRDIQMQALDPRVTVQACATSLQFEAPFANPMHVRVRCPQPQWQLFVYLQDTALLPPTASTSRTTPQAPTVNALVAKEVLKRGTLLSANLFEVRAVPAAGMEQQLVTDLKWVQNMELVRDLLPGVPLRTYDVKNAFMVKRGQEVLVSAGSAVGFVVTAKAEALQDGILGEVIRLKNQESGRSLSAEVTGPGSAKIR